MTSGMEQLSEPMEITISETTCDRPELDDRR